MEVDKSDPIADIVKSVCSFATGKDFSLPVFVQRAEIGLDMLNEFEIMRPDELRPHDYVKHFLFHYLIEDTINARFLWKRIPHGMKQPSTTDNKALIAAWEIGKALHKKNFAAFFELLEAFQPPTTHKEQNQMLAMTLKVVMREHCLDKLQRAYSAVPTDECKTMLGVTKDDQVKTLLSKRKMEAKGKYVYPPKESASKKEFEINEERIRHLTDVVMFLESQKIDLVGTEPERKRD